MAFRASRKSRAERIRAREERARAGAARGAGAAGAAAPPPSSSLPSTPPPVALLALSGGYHGDTLGAMDATEPSVFNGEAQTPWYSGRGLFLEPPTCGMEAGGEWRVRWLESEEESDSVPSVLSSLEGGEGGGDEDLERSKGRVVDEVGRGGLAALFSSERLRGGSDGSDGSGGAGAGGGSGGGGGPGLPLRARYKRHILRRIEQFEALPSSSSHSSPPPIIGALLFEPCLQGAGGMRLVDPAFQLALCDAARELGVPVVADEVFSGLWRLGAASGCELLGVAPDVACFAKLLTGGTVPLAATLATAATFEAFAAGGKAGALLHGHSYSAHAVGCAAACESLAMLSDPRLNPSVCSPPRPSSARSSSSSSPRSPCPSPSSSSSSRCVSDPECAAGGRGCGRLLPLWDQGLLERIAGHGRVRRAHAIGTVLAVELRDEPRRGEIEGKGGGKGGEKPGEKQKGNYTATASALVAASLRRRGVYARPLGDVVYLMITPVSAVGVGAGLQRVLLEALDE